MSHDSGFRWGGRDYAYRQKPIRGSRSRSLRQRKFEERLAQRFHDHERKEAQQPFIKDKSTEA